MSDLHQILRDYLSLRRSLGFKLKREGALLPDFVAFLERSASRVITVRLALAWAKQSPDATPYWWATRLGMVRGLARYARTIDSRHQVPPDDVLPLLKRPRQQPYIYSAADVTALMVATRWIRDPFRAHTCRTLIGLLASTGMRVGEAIDLDRTDLDPKQGIITVRHGKFGKSREVPLHSTTLDALEAYASHRRRISRPRSPAFFLSLAGTRLFYKNVHPLFLRLLEWAGLAERKPHRPRIHDLRHSFAVRTLADAYEKGLDVERQLPVLSTYLGHVSPSSTYWYLSAAPELLGVAARRLENSLGQLP